MLQLRVGWVGVLDEMYFWVTQKMYEVKKLNLMIVTHTNLLWDGFSKFGSSRRFSRERERKKYIRKRYYENTDIGIATLQGHAVFSVVTSYRKHWRRTNVRHFPSITIACGLRLAASSLSCPLFHDLPFPTASTVRVVDPHNNRSISLFAVFYSPIPWS